MSSQTRIPNRPAGAGRGPAHMMGAGMPAEKSLNFWPSAKRLMARLRPERLLVASILLLTVLGFRSRELHARLSSQAAPRPGSFFA